MCKIFLRLNKLIHKYSPVDSAKKQEQEKAFFTNFNWSIIEYLDPYDEWK